MEKLVFGKFSGKPWQQNYDGLILILDTETTGLPERIQSRFPPYYMLPFYNNARLIQLAWCVVDKNFNIKSYNSQYVYDGELVNHAEHINKISSSMLLEFGRPFDDVWNTFREDLLKCGVVVCHGCNFDLNIIASELFRRSNMDGIQELMMNKIHICTKTGDSIFKNGKYTKLITKPLSERINLDITKYPWLEGLSPHDALYDVFLTLELLKQKTQ